MSLKMNTFVGALVKRWPFIVSGALLALSSILSETLLGLGLAFLFALLLAWGSKRSSTIYRDFFLSGFVFTVLAFYWLPDTIVFFGGFSRPVSLLYFLLFSSVSAIQFVLCAFFYLRLQGTILRGAMLALPLAWLSSEFIYPRLFPWALGNALVCWTSIAGLAEYSGAIPLGVLLVWWAESVLSLFDSLMQRRIVFWRGQLFVCLFSIFLLFVGMARTKNVELELEQAPVVRTALVQGSIEAKDKGNLRLLDVNLERYQVLTGQATKAGAALVLWPESVFNLWVPEKVENIRDTRYDPFPGAQVPLVYGALSFRQRSKKELEEILSKSPSLAEPSMLRQLRYHRFNTAFALDGKGGVVGKYHKRVLMPFGEYIPFADRFPELKKLSPQTGDLSMGDLKEPMRLMVRGVGEGENIQVETAVGVLICYEDLVPSLSRQAVQRGANVLVNLTNDAWYGETAAPYQHHLLALWRAIEVRRFLLRVTNTGYTAVVDPFGRTRSGLPLFEEGFLLENVSLLGSITFYARWGDLPSWIVVIATIVLCVWRWRKPVH